MHVPTLLVNSTTNSEHWTSCLHLRFHFCPLRRRTRFLLQDSDCFKFDNNSLQACSLCKQLKTMIYFVYFESLISKYVVSSACLSRVAFCRSETQQCMLSSCIRRQVTNPSGLTKNSGIVMRSAHCKRFWRVESLGSDVRYQSNLVVASDRTPGSSGAREVIANKATGSYGKRSS